MLIIKQETKVTKFTIEFSDDELKLFVTAIGNTSYNERERGAVEHYGEPLKLSSKEQHEIFEQLGSLTGSKICHPPRERR